jgi:3-isopropylmalate/(R)-2-methylmalate dehydratase small subunit
MIETFSRPTGAIMHNQYTMSIARLGRDPYLFDEWRHEDVGYYGKPAGDRFCHETCGSSREHVPWALYQYGFRGACRGDFCRHLL